MILTITGIDKVGKTSLANYLSNSLGWPIVKFSVPPKDPYLYYMEFLLNNKEPAILDRFYIDECAYGPVKRGKSGLNEWQIRNIEMVLLMRNSFNIYASTDFNIIVDNFEKNKETFLSIDDIVPILHGFDKATRESLLNWYNFNYIKDGDYQKVHTSIKKWLNSFDISNIQSLIPTRVVGNYNAKTLILGEICNYKLEIPEYSHVIVPFANGPSANVLYGALDEFTNKVAISNVIKFFSNKESKTLNELNLPNLKRIICLGNNALEKYLELTKGMKLKLDVVKVQHPSYIARFDKDIVNYSHSLIEKIIW